MEEHLELIIEGRHRETALGPKERSDMKLNSSDFVEL